MTVIPGETQPSEGSESESVPVRFTVQDPGRKYLLTSTSSADRILWLRKLEEARKHCLLTERAVLQRQRSSNGLSIVIIYQYLRLFILLRRNSTRSSIDMIRI